MNLYELNNLIDSLNIDKDKDLIVFYQAKKKQLIRKINKNIMLAFNL
jgi:hypothetical protein